MNFTTEKKLDEDLMEVRVLRKYRMIDGGGESADSMRAIPETITYYTEYGKIENEVKNPNGTYTYDYKSGTTENAPAYLFEKTNYEFEPNHDLNKMIKELLFDYNIHKFSTDLQEIPHNIKDYYAKIDIEYEGEGLANIKDEHNYLQKSDKVDTVSIEEIKNYFTSKNNFISYFVKGWLLKENFKLGFDEIYENETVEDFLKRAATSLTITTKNIQEAIEKEEITSDEVKQWIRNYDDSFYIDARKIPKDIVEDMIKENCESKFRDIYPELLRKYNDNYDILKVQTDELLLTELDKILEKWEEISKEFEYLAGDAKYRGYIKYFEKFYNDPEALKKIIPYVMNIKIPYDFKHREFNTIALEFIKGIPKETLEKQEIRDIILENPDNLPIERLLLWDYEHFYKSENIKNSLLTEFEYDEKSANSLLNSLANSSGRYRLQTINAILNIAKQNHINNEKMSEAIQKNGLDIFSAFDEKDAQEFKNFGIKGIKFSNFKDKIIQERQFNYAKLFDNVTYEEFHSVINSNGIKKEDDAIDYEYIFYLMSENYSNNFLELLSRITPEAKDTIKKSLIDNLDRISLLQGNKYRWNDEDYDGYLSKAMNVMNESFQFTKDDLIKIYIKCINNGRPISSTLDNLMLNVPEEERENFKKETSNIYPNPKFEYFKTTSKYIPVKSTENRETIKKKIQQDGRCFSIKIKTDMVGESKEGKKIPVNNLSKWLFGVPGAKGKLIVRRNGYICLPNNTPSEVEKIIEESLADRQINNEHSK